MYSRDHLSRIWRRLFSNSVTSSRFLDEEGEKHSARVKWTFTLAVIHWIIDLLNVNLHEMMFKFVNHRKTENENWSIYPTFSATVLTFLWMPVFRNFFALSQINLSVFILLPSSLMFHKLTLLSSNSCIYKFFISSIFLKRDQLVLYPSANSTTTKFKQLNWLVLISFSEISSHGDRSEDALGRELWGCW